MATDSEGNQEQEEEIEQQITVLYRNVRGLSSTLKYLNKMKNKPDILILTEIWQEGEPSEVTGYRLVGYMAASRKKKVGRASGGVAVYKLLTC
jgi:hypothetical protein